MSKHVVRALILLGCLSTATLARTVSIHVPDDADPRVLWAAERLGASLKAVGCELTPNATPVVEISIEATRSDKAAKAPSPESYRLTAAGDRVSIVGVDAAGAMYGCLALAEQVRREKRLPEQLDQRDGPKMSLRGTCILLMKLGSYDYPITPKEFPFFYDRRMWTEYLDMLAANGFNYIAFWNGHPFDYFVKLDKYPEAQRGMEPGLLERNHEMLMWLGKEAEKRNIWLMFQFYNIHTSTYFQKAHKLPAWNPRPTPLLTDYTAECIQRFVEEFPSIGLYVCPGEALEAKYSVAWIKDVIFPAILRSGKTPPVMIRSWWFDVPRMKQLVGAYPRLYTERKFHVEMLAGTEVDAENREWAAITGDHVVNIHCVGNLEPFRWSPPSFVQRCMQSALREGGGTGLHLYPRKAWRWPYGCDRTDQPELQWDRDWLWFRAWGRYAWNPDRDPAAERQYWTGELANRYGAEAAPHVLAAFEESADVLPGLQRLLWLGFDNHTVVAAGAMLDQLATVSNPEPFTFLPRLNATRVGPYIEAIKAGRASPGQTPVEFLAEKADAAERAWREAQLGAKAARLNRDDAQRVATDMEAVMYIARFYRDKVAALVAKTRADAGIDVMENRKAFLRDLRASVDAFRQLTELTTRTYDSTSDVPPGIPTIKLPCPYHWSDILPIYEKELADYEAKTPLALDRPAWMDSPGIVMAGNWEEPSFRARRMGRTDYTLPPDKQAEYAQEHTPEMIARLKDLGVNFLTIHCYKGAGMKAERQDLDDAKQFAQLAHAAGLRVGTYIGGTMLYERLFEEEPNARQWQALGPKGEPIYYPDQKFRCTSVRNHPGFIEYLKGPVRFAVEQVHADLIHFDNFSFGAASYDPYSKERFREYLGNRDKTPRDPPPPDAPDSDPLVRDWIDYRCQALAEHYAAMAKYIRSLNPRCAVEANPESIRDGEPVARGVDHARLLPLGNAAWDENFGAKWLDKEGKVQSRIRSLKIGELFNNSTFLYCESPVELAESMAFNVNCLGAVAWFEWGKITSSPLSDRPPPKELKTYVRFFLDHQDLFRHATAVADVAVLRTFAEQAFGQRRYDNVEQALIEGHAAWRIIFDDQLDDLGGYRVLIAPDDPWLTTDQRRKIARFAARGGRVVRSTEINKPEAFLASIRDCQRVVVDAPRWVALELRQQSEPRRTLVHLVNYRADETVKNVAVQLRMKTANPKSVRWLSPDPATSVELPLERTPTGVSFVVPELKVYAVVVMDAVSA